MAKYKVGQFYKSKDIFVGTFIFEVMDILKGRVTFRVKSVEPPSYRRIGEIDSFGIGSYFCQDSVSCSGLSITNEIKKWLELDYNE